MPDRLYLEDLHVGQRFTSASYDVTAEEIVRFAAEWDPQPFHLDPEAAQATFFGGLAASGWHTAAISMRLNVAGGLPLAGGVIGTGGELLWLKPVRPGDTLRVEYEVLELTPSRSKPDRGTAIVRCATLNQHGEAVQTFTPKLVVFRRPR
ncbi:MAG: MaoC family dehydratase [Pseudomonadota bacterium]|nr:MaoC family dehydratase [Pseudomonadota bacterium]